MVFWKLDYTITPRFTEPHWIIRYDGMFLPNTSMDRYFYLEPGTYEKTMVEKFNGIVHNLNNCPDKPLYYVFFKTEEDMKAGFEWLQSIIMFYKLAYPNTLTTR